MWVFLNSIQVLSFVYGKYYVHNTYLPYGLMNDRDLLDVGCKLNYYNYIF